MASAQTVADLLGAAQQADAPPPPPAGFVPANDQPPPPPPGFVPESDVHRSFGDYAGMGARALMKGAEDLKDVLQPTLEQAFGLGGAHTLAQAVAGGVTGRNAGSAPTSDQAADASGFARPVTPLEKIGSRAVEFASQGVVGGLPTALDSAAETGARTVAQMLTREAASGAAAGTAAETANQMGAPQPVQTAAALIAGHAVATRFGPQAAKMVSEVPKDVAVTPEGELTQDGREIAAANNLHPDQVKAAYDHFDEVQAKTANDNPDLPPAEAPAMAVGDGLNRTPPDEPPVNPQAAEAVATGSAPEGQAAPETPSGAAPRLADAQSEGVDLTKGQATQDFTTQEQEQTLRRMAGTEEGAKAQAFYVKQQQQISDAVDRFKSALGNVDATPEERGAQIQDALRTLRDQGKAGVSALYRQAEDLAKQAGDEGANLTRLDTAELLAGMRKVWSDPLVADRVRNTLKEEAARYGLIGQDPTTVEGETTVRLKDASGQPAGRVSFVGNIEPLTISNAEALRQRINQMYAADDTKLSQGLKPLLDNAVQTAVERAATEAPGGVGDAFKAARTAHQQQMATYKAKDIVQSLVDWKKGATGTSAVSPDAVLKKILGNDADSVTALKKVKAVLLSAPTDKSRAAWTAIQAHAVAKIFDKASVLNANAGDGAYGAISGAKLNSEIVRFGVDKLKTILPQAEFDQLMKLNRIIRHATVPISGAVNHSGTAYALMNFLGKQGLKLASVARIIPGVGHIADAAAHVVQAGQQAAKAKATLKGIREFDLTQAANQDAETAKPNPGAFVRDFIDTAKAPAFVAPLLAGASTRKDQPQ